MFLYKVLNYCGHSEIQMSYQQFPRIRRDRRHYDPYFSLIRRFSQLNLRFTWHVRFPRIIVVSLVYQISICFVIEPVSRSSSIRVRLTLRDGWLEWDLLVVN